MRRQFARVCFALGCFALTAYAADIVPRIYRETEVSDIVVANEKLEAVQFTSMGLYWTFKDNARPLILATNDIPSFEYAPTNKAWRAVITGTIDSATQGRVRFDITPSQINTNGSCLFNVFLTSANGSNVLSRTRGDFIIWSQAGTGATGNVPTVVGKTVVGTWVDVNYVTNVQTFTYGAMTSWKTNNVER